MIIEKTVMAGSLESNDVLVTLRPWDEKKVILEIDSIVEKQFGDRIREIVNEVIHEQEIVSGYVQLQDRGALDFVIKARLETAIARAKEVR